MSLRFQTEHLTIRHFMPEDAADLAEILTDPEVTYFEPYETFTAEACKAEAAQFAQSESFFAVVLGDKVIGKLYFAKQAYGSYEIGYTFHGAYQGKGYAYESFKGMMAYAFSTLGVRRILAQINTRNAKSIRLAERLGMRREAEHKALVPRKENDAVFDDFYVYAMLQTEFPAEQ